MDQEIGLERLKRKIHYLYVTEAAL